MVLETLSPLERAAFVLREVFALPYAEVADTLDRSEAAARQLVSRARARVQQRAPRHPVDPQTHRELTTTFLAAIQGGASLEGLVPLLAPDVVLTTDGGRHTKAARRPIVGVAKVLRFCLGVLATPEVEALQWSHGQVNGGPAIVAHREGQIDAVVWLEMDGGLVSRIDMVRTPEKLTAVRV